MNPPGRLPSVSSPGATLLQRTEFRLALFGVAAVAAVYFGFIGLKVGTAEMLVKHYAYHVILLTFAVWCAML